MNVDLSNKMVQTHIVPRGTQGWGLKGKAGEFRGEGGTGLEGTEELPLLHCTRPQGETGLIYGTNLADRRARKVREERYKHCLSEVKHRARRAVDVLTFDPRLPEGKTTGKGEAHVKTTAWTILLDQYSR